MTYGSLFSGGGGSDIGLDRAGLRCLWQCECDAKANDVRRMHWNVPVVLDVRDTAAFEALPVPDVLWMSPPCQDLSVAGKRAGLVGARSGLFYDAVRVLGGFVRRGTRLALMEQVPGLLSSHAGEDFRAVLDSFLDIGACDVAWTVLDSQWFGVPQRRRRLYFAIDFGGECASEILALSYGMSGHSAPCRETGEGTSASVAPSLRAGGPGCERTGDSRGQDPVIAVAGTLKANNGGGGWSNSADHAAAGYMIPVAHSLRADGFDASEDVTGRGTPLVPVVAPTLRAGGNRTGGDRPPGTDVDTCETLIPYSIQHAQIGRKDEAGPQGKGWQENVAFTLDSRPCADAVAYPIDSQALRPGEAKTISPDANGVMRLRDPGLGIGADGDPSPTLQAANPHAVAYAPDRADCLNPGHEAKSSFAGDGGTINVVALNLRGRDDGSQLETSEIASIRSASGGSSRSYVGGMSVRRLMPIECERLQAWPDDWTRYGKREDGTVYELADGPRYKILGNGVTSSVSEWLGRQAIEHLQSTKAVAS